MDRKQKNEERGREKRKDENEENGRDGRSGKKGIVKKKHFHLIGLCSGCKHHINHVKKDYDPFLLLF